MDMAVLPLLAAFVCWLPKNCVRVVTVYRLARVFRLFVVAVQPFETKYKTTKTGVRIRWLMRSG